MLSFLPSCALSILSSLCSPSSPITISFSLPLSIPSAVVQATPCLTLPLFNPLSSPPHHLPVPLDFLPCLHSSYMTQGNHVGFDHTFHVMLHFSRFCQIHVCVLFSNSNKSHDMFQCLIISDVKKHTLCES